VNDVGVISRERECSTCRWFDRGLFEGDDSGSGPGYCRRYPPVMYFAEGRSGGSVKQAQPVVQGWEWCGEWSQA